MIYLMLQTILPMYPRAVFYLSFTSLCPYPVHLYIQSSDVVIQIMIQ